MVAEQSKASVLRSWMRKVVGSNPDGGLYRTVRFSFVDTSIGKRLLRDRDRTGTTTIAMVHRLKKGDCFKIEIELETTSNAMKTKQEVV